MNENNLSSQFEKLWGIQKGIPNYRSSNDFFNIEFLDNKRISGFISQLVVIMLIFYSIQPSFITNKSKSNVKTVSFVKSLVIAISICCLTLCLPSLLNQNSSTK